MYSAATDSELVAAARRGDTSAIPTLFRRHHQSLLKVAGRATLCQPDAEDAVSDAFLGLLGALDRGCGPTTHVWAYLATSVRRAAARSARQRQRTSEPQLLAGQGDLESKVVEHLAIRQAFANLPARWRTVLWLVEVEGLSRYEVAPIMGTSACAIAMTASRARGQMRAEYLAATAAS